ncbi:MAG: cell division protease FtsH, partial [Solirubrobacteraceae bacterium]|nr:cell division protease FtsH [Solirubrobacteraceae bacterium]
MSRFFKSAAFPILIVIVLAFFASKLISDSSRTDKPDFAKFYSLLHEGQIETATLNTKDESLDFVVQGGQKYEIGVPGDAYSAVLTNQLLQAQNDGDIKSFVVKKASTSVILSLLTYVLPFLLFFGLWIFLMNQVQGGGSKVMSFG